MQFGNIHTGEIKTALPTVLALEGKTITGADITHWAALGWRRVVEVEQPAEGYRAAGYNVVEVDGLTCQLTLTGSINIADEQAAAAAAQIEADKASAKLLSDVATSDVGRVIRAFAALVMEQFNVLRAREGLAQFTAEQFIAALKVKIDEQA